MSDQKIEYGKQWAKVHVLPDPGYALTLDAGGTDPDSLTATVVLEAWDIAIRIEEYGTATSRWVTPDEAERLGAWLLSAARYAREQEAEDAR